MGNTELQGARSSPKGMTSNDPLMRSIWPRGTGRTLERRYVSSWEGPFLVTSDLNNVKHFCLYVEGVMVALPLRTQKLKRVNV